MILSVVAVVAAAVTVAPADTPLMSSLISASKFCEASSQSGKIRMPEGGDFFMDASPLPNASPAAIAEMERVRASMGMRPTTEVPTLIKRFAVTQAVGETAQANVFVRFKANETTVWAVHYKQMPACEVAITGASQMPLLPEVTKAFVNDGWTVLKAYTDASKNPISSATLVKRTKGADSDLGLRVSIMLVDHDGSHPDGIQASLSYLAGTLRVPSSPAQPATQP